jgi:O-antigen ligase
MLSNLKAMTDRQDKLFFVFWLLTMTLLLIELLLDWNVEFFPTGSVLIAIFSMILFFERYSYKKILYYIWVSMMLSVIMCYYFPVSDIYTFRGSGGTEDSNEFATQLFALLFAAIYLFKYNKSKIFLSLSIVFFLYAFFKAGSMSAFLAIGLLGSLNIIRFIILKPQYFVNFKVLLLLFVFFGAVMQIDFKKIELVNDMLGRTKNTGSAEMRFHVWTAGKHMLENNPILGIGVNAFANYEKQYEEGHMIGAVTAPHSIYVKLLAESGPFMFVLFFTYIGYILLLNMKVFWFTHEWFILNILFAYLFMGLTLGYLYDKHFWTIIALVMNLNHQLKRNKLNR